MMTRRSSGGLEEGVDTNSSPAKQAEARASSINVLQGRLKRLGEGFTKPLCGLISTKLKGRLESGMVIAKTGVEVEIKFGKTGTSPPVVVDLSAEKKDPTAGITLSGRSSNIT